MVSILPSRGCLCRLCHRLFGYLQFIKSTLDGNTRLQKINDPTDPLQTVWKIIEKLCVKNSLLTLHDVPFSEIPFRECPRPWQDFKETTVLSLYWKAQTSVFPFLWKTFVVFICQVFQLNWKLDFPQLMFLFDTW